MITFHLVFQLLNTVSWVFSPLKFFSPIVVSIQKLGLKKAKSFLVLLEPFNNSIQNFLIDSSNIGVQELGLNF